MQLWFYSAAESQQRGEKRRKKKERKKNSSQILAGHLAALRVSKRRKGAPGDEKVPAGRAGVDLGSKLILAADEESQGEDCGEARDLRKEELIFF